MSASLPPRPSALETLAGPSGSSSLLLAVAPAPNLDPALPPAFTSAAARDGSSSQWRNIPAAVRESLASLAETALNTDARVTALASAVKSRAGQVEVAAVLSRAATADAVNVLTRFLQRDVLPRFDTPCVSAAAAAERARVAEARVAVLEATVAAHDAALRDARAEFSRETSEILDAVRRAADAASVAASDVARASETDAASMRARIDALAQVVDGAASAHADVAAATSAALNSSRERLRSVEAGLTDLLSGLGIGRVGGGGGGGGVLEARAALERAVENAVKNKLVALTRSVEALVASVKERLSDDVSASVDAAVAAAKSDIAAEVKKSQRARSEVRAAAAAAAMVAPQSDSLGDIRAAVDAAVNAAVAPLHALVLAATSQVDEANARATEAAASAVRTAEGASSSARAAEMRLEARLHALESRFEESSARNGFDAAIKSIEAKLDLRVGESASEAAVAASASEARAAAMSAAADAAAANAALRALSDISSRARSSLSVPPETPDTAADALLVPSTPLRALADSGSTSSSSAIVAGRWIWKSRTFSSCEIKLDPRFRIVAFDVSALNTAPDILRFGVDSGTSAGGGDEIVASKSGLYRVSLGFFSAVPPTLALVVNENVAFTALPPLLRPPTKEEDLHLPDASEYAPSSIVVHSHPCGSVAGVSFTQYVALPSGARLRVAYAGESRGQGFFELQKL